jgi:hypothetical protein
MMKLTRDKFKRNKDLRERLLQTGGKKLQNTLNFRIPAEATEEKLFWGLYKEKGENTLGAILETVRTDIQSGSDLLAWLHSSHTLLEAPRKVMPKLTLEVFKDGHNIETATLQG